MFNPIIEAEIARQQHEDFARQAELYRRLHAEAARRPGLLRRALARLGRSMSGANDGRELRAAECGS